MSGYVFFQMMDSFRLSLIDRHLFYVDQARKRLLSQFDDIENEAHTAAAAWLKQHSSRFDPDRHDPGGFYESANDAGIEFYQLLSDMRDNTRLSVVAGMFHEWDKQLRDWLVGEVKRWHRGDEVISKLWCKDFGEIANLLEAFGWKVRSAKYFERLNACRLVVNVYKHGDGKSFNDLKRDYPEYLKNSFKGIGGSFSGVDFSNHADLAVNDDQSQEFSNAIVEFWQDVPANISNSEIASIPHWLEKAILKDRVSAANW